MPTITTKPPCVLNPVLMDEAERIGAAVSSVVATGRPRQWVERERNSLGLKFRTSIRGLAIASGLIAHASAQNPVIPDYQTREGPDGCTATPPGYPAPPYSVFRDMEDYTYLRDPAKRGDPADPIKYLPLNSAGDIYLSFGGEARERWEYYSAPPLGQGPPGATGYYLARYLVHADLHVGETFRLFAQFQSNIEDGRNGGPRPSIDEDRANLHQLYLDINLPPLDETRFSLRVGRQELGYGIGRLIDPREGPNARQSFDGVKGMLHVDKWEIDAFATRLVENNFDRFDNPDPYTKFWGLYATRDVGFVPGGGVDLYYLGTQRNFAPYDSRVDFETRHMLGARLHGKKGGFDFDMEGGWQFGTFGAGDIDAWFLSGEWGWTFERAFGAPHVALKMDIASGNRNPAAADLGTFHLFYMRGSYFTEPTPIGNQNLINIHPEIDWRLGKSLTFTLTPNFYWRQSTRDGLYDAGGFPLAAGAAGTSRYVGTELNFFGQWQIQRHLTFSVSYSHFFAGDFTREVPGGRSYDYVASWLTLKF